jgi:hypothetical protein
VVIDTHIEGWKRHLGDVEGRYRAMLSVASLIAGLLPPDTAAQVRQLTDGRDLVMFDDTLRPVENPQLLQIARILPTDTAFQLVRAACALGFDVSDVTAEVANAVNRTARSPKGGRRAQRDDPRAGQTDQRPPAPGLAKTSFPHSPFAPRADAAPAVSLTRATSPGSRPQSVPHSR